MPTFDLCDLVGSIDGQLPVDSICSCVMSLQDVHLLLFIAELNQLVIWMRKLSTKYKLKLKGTGSISCYLGCDFFCDDDNTLCMAPQEMVASYVNMFGTEPSCTVTSLLEKIDHPELDTSALLDEKGIAVYQSFIGSMQWAVSLGRLDTFTAIVILYGFQAVLHQEHFDKVKRVYECLSKMKHVMTQFSAGEPDYSAYTVYGNVKEVIPGDVPEPLNNWVTLIHCVAANLYHGMMTRWTVTGIIPLLNKTPIGWFFKKQATVETATYGSEFIATRTCVQQVIYL